MIGWGLVFLATAVFADTNAPCYRGIHFFRFGSDGGFHFVPDPYTVYLSSKNPIQQFAIFPQKNETSDVTMTISDYKTLDLDTGAWTSSSPANMHLAYTPDGYGGVSNAEQTNVTWTDITYRPPTAAYQGGYHPILVGATNRSFDPNRKWTLSVSSKNKLSLTADYDTLFSITVKYCHDGCEGAATTMPTTTLPPEFTQPGVVTTNAHNVPTLAPDQCHCNDDASTAPNEKKVWDRTVTAMASIVILATVVSVAVSFRARAGDQQTPSDSGKLNLFAESRL